MGFTKKADTLYLVKNGFEEWCKTDRCNPFYSEYKALTDNYVYGGKNLQEGMIRRSLAIRFDTEKLPLKINMICEYKSTFEGPNRLPDTVNTNGSYKVLSNAEIIIDAGTLNELTGKYNVTDLDLFQMKLTKTK